MSLVITNPLSNIPKAPKSHNLGYAQIWADQLKAQIDHTCTKNILNADIVYINHGVNFTGSVNLFGGIDQNIFDRINTIINCKNIISLEWDVKVWVDNFRKRIGNSSTYDKVTEQWCDKLESKLQNVPILKQEDLNMDGITVGDSHTLAFSAKTDKIYRRDGATLHGALKSGLKNLFRDKPIEGNITFCFGSIDIRHHLLRHHNIDLKSMIKEYIKQAKECTDNPKFAVPVPVEYEKRKLPKTGYYKGTPFFGSQLERKRITDDFISILTDESKGNVVMPPRFWYDMDPEKYALNFMEKGSSVHIAPPHYRRNDFGSNPLTI
tara:strand:- start:3488 stop:4453 length:966 start_codon:yes stop_codon:yes gene_type:complete